MFYEKCFHFRLLKKSNASEFASGFFLQSASLPQKFNRFQLPHLCFEVTYASWILQLSDFHSQIVNDERVYD